MARHIILALAVLACGIAFASAVGQLDRPVFGILSAPTGIDLAGDDAPYPGKYYIPASYIKFVESNGARAVPIMYDITEPELRVLYTSLNGVLFPGGGSSLEKGAQYRNLTTLLMNLTIESAQNGNWVPLWGTCLGFQAIMVDAADNANVLTGFNSENISLPLIYSGVCQTESCRLFGPTFPSTIVDLFSNQSLQIAFNNHQSGISPANFKASPNLANNYRLIATSIDRNGNEFVAVAEHKQYPIYATQFHPEKPVFEWNEMEVIPHTGNAVMANIFLSSFLVTEARKNNNKFATEQDEFKFSIDNYPAIFTGAGTTDMNMFDQCYFFNGTNTRGKGKPTGKHQ